MRESIRGFAKVVAETLPIVEPICEFGSFQVSGQEEFADLRPFFPSKKYIGADLQEGVGVDAILNIYNIGLLSESVGTVICFDTLEHVEYPRKAINELERILKPNGVLILGSPMDFPIHDFPDDFWRFTPSGFKSLLSPFPQIFVEAAGNEDFPHTVVGIGFKNSKTENITGKFAEKIKVWKEHHKIAQKKSWKRLLKITISPFRLAIYRRIEAQLSAIETN